MKVWEKMLNKRLKKIVNIDKSQFGFITGRSTSDAIFITRQLQGNNVKRKKSCTTCLSIWKRHLIELSE